jgi:hypothetical protein
MARLKSGYSINFLPIQPHVANLSPDSFRSSAKKISCRKCSIRHPALLDSGKYPVLLKVSDTVGFARIHRANQICSGACNYSAL